MVGCLIGDMDRKKKERREELAREELARQEAFERNVGPFPPGVTNSTASGYSVGYSCTPACAAAGHPTHVHRAPITLVAETEWPASLAVTCAYCGSEYEKKPVSCPNCGAHVWRKR